MRVAEAGLLTIAVLGLRLLLHGARRPSLGQGALMAVGGYTTALLAARHGVAGAATLPAAAAAGAAGALLVALPAARLAPRYLALPSLGLALALPALLAGFAPVRLPHGESALAAAALAWGCAGALLAAASVLRRRVAQAPWPAVAALAGALAGLAGGLLVLQQGAASAALFPARLSLLLAAAAAGPGGPPGAVAGGFAVVYLPDLVGLERHGPGPSTVAFGVLLVLAAMLAPAARRLRR